LAQLGSPLPVYVGLRNSQPFFPETLKQMNDDGVKRALGFILSSHRTEASWERYQKNIADARVELGGDAPQVDYCRGWHDHPLFIQCWVDLIQLALRETAAAPGNPIPLVFTAHSLPTPMAARSPYVEQFETTARLIAGQLDHPRWSVAYQSRSGKPTDPWLAPDIDQVIKDLARDGVKQMVVAPIGFVCDHVEVLYDLDIAAKQSARQFGINLIRAGCPNDHATFIRMMAEVIEKTMNPVEDKG
jgi:protoporphyrin/coproporphyrin ferrochelatase